MASTEPRDDPKERAARGERAAEDWRRVMEGRRRELAARREWVFVREPAPAWVWRFIVGVPALGALAAAGLFRIGWWLGGGIVGVMSLLWAVLVAVESAAYARNRRRRIVVDRERRLIILERYDRLRGGERVGHRGRAYRYEDVERLWQEYMGHGGSWAHFELDDGAGGVERLRVREHFGDMSLYTLLREELNRPEDVRDPRFP